MAINEKKNGYQVRVRDFNGRWFPYKTFKRKVDARRYEAQLLHQRAEGALAPLSKVRKLSLNVFFEEWMNECRSNVSNGWKNSNRQIYRSHIKDSLGNKFLVKISKRDIGAIITRAKQRGLAPQSQAHIFNMLHKMFDDAIHHFEYLTFNPVIKKYKPSIPKKERNFLKNKDAWKLLNYSRDHWLGPAIWLSSLAALRPCEVQGLKWSSVDFSLKRIIISTIFNRKEKRLQNHPKQEDWGQAPIPLVLESFLKPLRERQFISEFVACGPDGTMLSYSSYLKGLKTLCRAAGVQVVTPHELRHTATELYYTAGANTEDLKRLLNHSSVRTTETYIHRTPERLADIAGKLNPPIELIK